MAFVRFQHPGSAARPTLLGSAVAWLAVALVGLLAWLAADPAAHEFFHPEAAGHAACGRGHAACAHDRDAAAGGSGAGDAPGDHQCVITAFAAGATDLLVVALFVFSGLRRIVRFIPAIMRVAGDTPFLRHAPSCGPPVCA